MFPLGKFGSVAGHPDQDRSIPLSTTMTQRLRYEVIHLWGLVTGSRLVNIGFALPDQPPGTVVETRDLRARGLTVYAELATFVETSACTPPVRGLEIGCGQGDGLRRLGDVAGGRWTGIDLSAVATLICRLRGLDARLGTNTALPFTDNAVDRVVAVEALFIFPRSDEVLREAARVLAPGGRIGIAEFRRGSIDDTRRFVEARAEAAGLELAAFADRTEDARCAILTGEPARAALLSLVPSPLRAGFTETLSLAGSDRHRSWREGEFCFFLAVLKRRGDA